MKNKKIIIAGGSGFIGEEMIRYFGKDNDICILTRQVDNGINNRNHYHSLHPEELNRVSWVQWDGITTSEWVKELDGADLLINLSGKSVNCRYTEKNKQEILSSRINPVNTLGKAIALCKRPPACWINASSATIYRHATDHARTNTTANFMTGFLLMFAGNGKKPFMISRLPIPGRSPSVWQLH